MGLFQKKKEGDGVQKSSPDAGAEKALKPEYALTPLKEPPTSSPESGRTVADINPSPPSMEVVPSTANRKEKSLIDIAESGDYVKLLSEIQGGANVNVADKYGVVPLQAATWMGQLAVVQLLVESGANINHKDADGWSALHYGAKYGRTPVCKFLLQKGAEMDARNQNEETPLHLAARMGNDQVVYHLVNIGANINAVDKCNVTPLHRAALHGRLMAVQTLLSLGADASIKTFDGNIAAEWASDPNVRKLFEYRDWEVQEQAQ